MLLGCLEGREGDGEMSQEGEASREGLTGVWWPPTWVSFPAHLGRCRGLPSQERPDLMKVSQA